jgi:hypothetical protein
MAPQDPNQQSAPVHTNFNTFSNQTSLFGATAISATGNAGASNTGGGGLFDDEDDDPYSKPKPMPPQSNYAPPTREPKGGLFDDIEDSSDIRGPEPTRATGGFGGSNFDTNAAKAKLDFLLEDDDDDEFKPVEREKPKPVASKPPGSKPPGAAKADKPAKSKMATFSDSDDDEDPYADSTKKFNTAKPAASALKK